MPVASNEPGQATEPPAVIALAPAESSTTDDPPADDPPAAEPAAPAAQTLQKHRNGHSVTRKRHREDSVTVGSVGTTSERTSARAATGHADEHGAPARKKKKKKEGIVQR